MTPDQLAEIERRAEAATPGPWTAKHAPISDWDWYVAAGACALWDDHGSLEHEADAHFIAHARADIPALIAAVRERDERIAALEARDERIVALEAKVQRLARDASWSNFD